MSKYEYGSQLCMQLYANNKNAYDELNFKALITKSYETTTKDFNNRFILKQKDLIWLSPLKLFDYKEFQLRESCFWNFINIFNCINSANKISFPFNQSFINSVWGTSGKSPEWDGIALSADKKTLYLFEAKSNIGEVNDNYKVIPGTNQKVIYDIYNNFKNSFDFSIDYNKYLNALCIKSFIGNIINCEQCPYTESFKLIDKKCHYQILNRLWFFDIIRYYINKFSFDYIIDNAIDNVQLVFLNFCKDNTNKSTSKEEFETNYFIKNNVSANGIWNEFNNISKTKKTTRYSMFQLPNEDISVIYFDADYITKAYCRKNINFDIAVKNEIIQTKFWGCSDICKCFCRRNKECQNN